MQARTQTRRRNGGFSLIEVLIAVTIIALMAGGAAVYLFPELFAAKRTRAQQDIEILKQAVNNYRRIESSLPQENEWPTFLVEGSKRRPEPYIDPDKAAGGEVLDPWDNPYVYRRLSSRDFEIISYGADGAQGGEGDDADISSKKKDN